MATSAIQSNMEYIASLLNSGFISSLFGALCGAFAGAWAANRITEKTKSKQLLIDQIRAANTANITAWSIANIYLSFKKSHTKNICEDYAKQKERFKIHLNAIESGSIAPETLYKVHAELKRLSTLDTPISILKKYVYEKLSLNARPLALITSISGLIDSLNSTIHLRNNLIEKLSDISDHNEFACTYLGIPDEHGNIRTEYSDYIKGIEQYVDNIIYFSYLLSIDLVNHAKELRSKYETIYKKETIKITSASFENAKNDKLFPDESKYKDREESFKDLG